MIGYYNRSIITTYFSVCVSVAGMALAIDGQISWSLICLMLSGFYDVIDGRIARACKRTHADELNGIQLDSLSDMICFGALPVVILFNAGLDELYYLPVLAFFLLAGLTRLSYYNVQADLKDALGETVDGFEGMPITTISILLPIIYSLHVFTGDMFEPILALAILIIGAMYLSSFKFCKHPGKLKIGVLIILVMIGFTLIAIYR